MKIVSQEEIIENDIKMNDWLIICVTILPGCDTPITSMINLERMVAVMKVVVATEMRSEMVGRLEDWFWLSVSWMVLSLCDSGVDPFIDVDQVDVLEPATGSTSAGTSGHTCTLCRLALGCIFAPPMSSPSPHFLFPHVSVWWYSSIFEPIYYGNISKRGFVESFAFTSH